MAAKVSKNQRAGGRQVHRVPTCRNDHKLERVLVVRVRGRRRLEWRHADVTEAAACVLLA
jgi:hypothetical protein